MTNSQAAAHESWLVRCSPRALGFNCEQSASITLILQKSANATCTQPCDPPTLSVLHANFVAIGENIVDFSGNRTRAFSVGPREYSSLLRESNQGFLSGTSASQPQCYILMLCYKFHRYFYPTTTVQDWPWTYSSFQSLHKTFFLILPRPNI